MKRARFRNEDHEWLAQAMSNALAKAKDNKEYTYEFRWQLERIVEALQNSEDLGEDESLIPNEKTSVKPKATMGQRAWNLCPNHPNYAAKRVPRTDCESCWAAYKQLNPTKYDYARRKFDRSQ